MFGIYLQMYNLHLKLREKTKVSGGEMFLVPFRRGPTAFEGAQLGREKNKSLTERAREVSCSCQHSPLSFRAFVPHVRTAGGAPSSRISRRSLEAKGI